MTVQSVSLCGTKIKQQDDKKTFGANNCLPEHDTKKEVNIVLFLLNQY